MFDWLKATVRPTKTVLCKDTYGDWVERKAELTASGWFVMKYPNMREGGCFLRDDGTTDGLFFKAWRPK